MSMNNDDNSSRDSNDSSPKAAIKGTPQQAVNERACPNNQKFDDQTQNCFRANDSRMDESRAKLLNELMTGFWSDIKPHAERGAVFLVSPELELVDVGASAATDQVDRVVAWIDSQQLTRPTLKQVEEWNQSSDRSFKFLIIAPYVFIQELPH